MNLTKIQPAYCYPPALIVALLLLKKCPDWELQESSLPFSRFEEQHESRTFMTREFLCSFFTCSALDCAQDTLFPLIFSSETRIKNVYAIFLGILTWFKLGEMIPLLSQYCNGEIMRELILHTQENLILQFQEGQEGFL